MAEKSEALPVAKLFEYFDKLDTIPSEVIKQYLQREEKLQSKRATIAESLQSKPKSFDFSEISPLVDSGVYDHKPYLFPKWFGRNEQGKAMFVTDGRLKRSRWFDENSLTKNHLNELFGELKAQNLVKSRA